MANESVTQTSGAESIGRCKHDAKMVNEVSERLAKMRGVVDLLMCARNDLMEDTIGNIGWLLLDMIDDTKKIVCEKQEAKA